MPTIEEHFARHLAAKDWLEDPADDTWWQRGPEKFRTDYLAYAREVIALIRPGIAHELAEQQRRDMHAPGRSHDASRWNRCVDMTADSIDPEV